MEKMDHTEAIRLQAAAKYALGELSPAQMDEYEEHYFDCAECALDVKAIMAFADDSCKVFREQDQREVVPEPAPSPKGWFAWLKPAFAVPAFAVLLLAIVGGYIRFSSVSKGNGVGPVAVAVLHVQPTVGVDRILSSSFRIHDSRGAINDGSEPGLSEDRVSVHSGQTFELDFDFSPKPQFSHYVGQLQDETGKPVLELSLSSEMVRREIHVPVPAGLVHNGIYRLVISGDPNATGKFIVDKNKEAARYTFPVEILP
jgi:hypothetical protein